MIAIDTETTGLFIHKGCKPFMVTACTYEKKYVWQWKVNPYDRSCEIPTDIHHNIIDTILEHKEIIFHNANFDIRALESIGIPRDFLFENFTIHDSMVMSHAYQSNTRHGLKEQAVLRCDYPDTDETLLADITKAARNKAKKFGWRIAEKNDEHETIEGTKNSHYKCDYWVPKQIAEYLKYGADHPWNTACETYGACDAERTICLFTVLSELLQSEKNISLFQNVTGTLYDKYEEARQLIPKLLDMQAEGLTVLSIALEDSINLFNARKIESLDYLRWLCKNPSFNPQSPIQLREVLFEYFDFIPTKQTTVGPSTDKDVLSSLLKQCPVEPGIQLPAKFKFLVALKEFRKEKTTHSYLINYRVHGKDISDTHKLITPSFSQTGTNSGRLSCKEPNMTNVGKKDMSNPIDDIKDKVRATILAELLELENHSTFSLRNMFGPLPKEHWTCIDYDQFQLRIFAVVSESYELIEGFERGEDIHQVVGKVIFQKDIISDVERTAAKCFHPDTEVLTKTGWKCINQLVKGEEVIQAIPLNNNQVNLEWVVPTEVFTKTNDHSELVHLENEGINLKVTPDHRMLAYRNTGRSYVTTPNELHKARSWVNAGTLHTATRYIDEALLRVAIAVQADGNYSYKQIRLGFTKERKIIRCRKLLKDANIQYREKLSSQGITVFTIRGTYVDAIKYLLDADKTLSWNMLNLSIELREVILDEVKYWDSHIRDNWQMCRYTSVVKKNLDVLQAIAAITNRKTAIREDNLTIRKNNKTRGGALNTSEIPYKSEVSCLSVPSTFVLVRDKGIPVITGQSINFGLLFGAGAKKIELLAGVPGLYNAFMANFPKAKIYLDKQSRIAANLGYVHTVGGYRLYVPRDRAYAASCYVIQGTEAEIVRNAIINVSNYQAQTNYKLILMVHDELIFRSKQHNQEELNAIMKIMEDTGKKIGIPCKVDAKYTTTNWADRTKDAPIKKLLRKPIKA